MPVGVDVCHESGDHQALAVELLQKQVRRRRVESRMSGLEDRETFFRGRGAVGSRR